MIKTPFFTQFLKISNFYTIGALILLALAILLLRFLKTKKIDFSIRMITALIIGLMIGIFIDFIGGKNGTYVHFAQMEISAWYELLGTGFLKLIQLLAVPVVFLSIIKVVIDVQGERLRTLTSKTFVSLLGTTAISAMVGILVVKIYRLNGAAFAGNLTGEKASSMRQIASQSFPEFFLNLIPSNIVESLGSNESIVSVVIIAALFAGAIRFLKVKKTGSGGSVCNNS
ncbi:cation:dicarboxylate symporter family transporter [Melissococcus plutonius]|uniref:cation:dicarboxylate symporter family transporter n=1 Tax=Melissococcus plutonius TaxID=33970 RepID=UPI000F7BF521|nr:cation:dicarboxylase symporter family transporter [Melissococcus plutonius]BBD16035.1 proton/glutamate symport protein [Melissococcus plutonius]